MIASGCDCNGQIAIFRWQFIHVSFRYWARVNADKDGQYHDNTWKNAEKLDKDTLWNLKFTVFPDQTSGYCGVEECFDFCQFD